MSFPFNQNNWYWVVAGSATQVYSSAAGDYLSVTDPTYQAWLSNGGRVTKIDTETSLGGALAGLSAPRPVNANVLVAYQNALAGGVNAVVFRILFNHENRIRALEGKAPLTVQQALQTIATLL